MSFRRALPELFLITDVVFVGQFEEFHTGFGGSLRLLHLLPRSMNSSQIDQLLFVQGIVSKCSLIQVLLTRSVHCCPATKTFLKHCYGNTASLEPFLTSSSYPTEDEDENLLEMEYGLSTDKNHQAFVIQDIPEKVPNGHLPRSVVVIAYDDLIDRCEIGDRVQVVGMCRCLLAKKGDFTNVSRRTVLIANNIRLMNEGTKPKVPINHTKKIRSCSRQQSENVLKLLADFIELSTCDHEDIERTIVCILHGGIEQILSNGTRLCGDTSTQHIHVAPLRPLHSPTVFSRQTSIDSLACDNIRSSYNSSYTSDHSSMKPSGNNSPTNSLDSPPCLITTAMQEKLVIDRYRVFDGMDEEENVDAVMVWTYDTMEINEHGHQSKTGHTNHSDMYNASISSISDLSLI